MSNIGYGFKAKPAAATIPANAIVCKCQICNCGSHKCPADHHRFELTPTEKDALRSNYQSDFPAHPLSRVPKRNENAPRQETIFGNGKFDAQTTCQSDFRAPQGGAARAAKPPVGDPMLINNGNNQRSFTSENAASFSPKGYAMRESYAPTSSHTTKLPFEGQSTYSDYKSHAGAKPSTPFREQSTLSGAKEDRDFQSEAALKFVQHGNQRRQGFAPQARDRSTLPFEGQSTSSSDYRGLSAPPAQSFAPRASHSMDKDTRDFQSSNASDYQPKGYQVRESYKPAPDRSAANVPFEGRSTTNSDFTGQQGTKAVSARPRGGLTDTIGVAIGAKDDRQWVSENRGQYDPKGFAARQGYHPTSSHTTKLPFEGQSTSATDYRAHNGAKPSTPFREQSTLSGAKEDRDFQSESALKFVGHSGVLPRESFQPNNRSRVNLPFEGQSTSSSDYRAHQLQGCPAKEIPDFDGHQANQEGHKLLTNAGGQWHPYQQGTGPRR